jgi:hypothetical protein
VSVAEDFPEHHCQIAPLATASISLKG